MSITARILFRVMLRKRWIRDGRLHPDGTLTDLGRAYLRAQASHRAGIPGTPMISLEVNEVSGVDLAANATQFDGAAGGWMVCK